MKENKTIIRVKAGSTLKVTLDNAVLFSITGAVDEETDKPIEWNVTIEAVMSKEAEEKEGNTEE